MLLQCPLLVGPRVPEVPLPPPLRPLATSEVTLLNQTLEGTLDSAHSDGQTLFPLQLGSKVLGGNTRPRATVCSVQVTALGLLTEDHGNPPKDPWKKQGVEGVGQ